MGPRPLRPKNEGTTSEGDDTKLELQGGKRRAISSACIPCRRRKSKCDGALPACSTCTAVYRTECTYDADSDHRRKGALKRDIQSLQQRNDAFDVIVTALRDLPEDESLSILRSLRGEISLDAIADSLRTDVKLPHNFGHQTLEGEFAEQLSPTSGSSRGANTSLSRSREDSTEEGQLYSGAPTPAETSNMWFRVPHDASFIEHLLNLYFCWIHPFYQFFSQEQFLYDMSRGRTDHCSRLLVNAVLSFACHYSDRDAARANPRDPATAGDDFFKEAKRQLEKLESPSLTTVQALAIMSVRETSHGRDSSGYQYVGRSVRMAIELGLHLSILSAGLRSSETETRKLTFWSVFNLETFYSVFVGRLSQLPRSAADVQKPAISDRTEEQQIWRYYDDTDRSSSRPIEQPARSMLFFNQLTSLSEISSDMVADFYAPREPFTSRRLSITYGKYSEWYQNLPDAFRLGNASLPHVIVLHMYYYGCVLHLFRPYIKLDLRYANLFPRDTCTFCANEISGLVNTLREMYGLRRICLHVISLLFSASTIHLLNIPSEQSVGHLSQAISDLQDMSTNHRFAMRCINIIRSLASRWKISLPGGAFETLPGADEKLPSASSSTFWSTSIPQDSSFNISPHFPGYGPQDLRALQPSPAQVQAPFSPFMDADPPMHIVQSRAHNAFWTAFPSQGLPVSAHNVVPSMSMQSTSMEEDSRQWSPEDRSLSAARGHESGTQQPSSSSNFPRYWQ